MKQSNNGLTNYGALWGDTEIDFLKEKYANGEEEYIVSKLSRNWIAIRAKSSRLGLSRENHREAWNKGLNKNTDPRVKKYSNSLKGKIFSEEHRKNISMSLKGKVPPIKGVGHSISTRKKLSDIAKYRFKNGYVNPFKGRKHSEETKKKISLNHWSKKVIPAWCKGKKLSESTKKKISEKKTKILLDKKLIEKMYNYEKNTVLEMSAYLGCSASSVIKNLRIHGIKLRVRGELLSLEKHPNWMGGKSFEPYSTEFNKKLKEIIRKRDNGMCQNCFDEGKNKLHIHHIDYNKKNNIKENLILLCNSCHSKTNFSREYWKKYFLEKRKE